MLFLILFVLLLLAWIFGFIVFHVAGAALHILLILAVISLIVHFVAEEPEAQPDFCRPACLQRSRPGLFLRNLASLYRAECNKAMRSSSLVPSAVSSHILFQQASVLCGKLPSSS